MLFGINKLQPTLKIKIQGKIIEKCKWKFYTKIGKNEIGIKNLVYYNLKF